MFNVSHLTYSNIIVSVMGGFFTVEEVEQYANRAEPLIRRAAECPRGYRILIDVRGCAIQAQAVIAAFERHVTSVPRAQRCAVVTGDSIVRMQIRRILTGSHDVQAFERYEDAHLWLCSDDPADP